MYKSKKKRNIITYCLLTITYNLFVTRVHSQNKISEKLMQRFIVEFKFKVVYYKTALEVYAKQFE